MIRDQSEDRQQSNNIVFGFTAYPGAPTSYGVMRRDNSVLIDGIQAALAVKAAGEFDVIEKRRDERRALRAISDLAVTPEEDEAFAKFIPRFMHVC